MSASTILPTFAFAALGTVTVLLVAMIATPEVDPLVGPSARDGGHSVTVPQLSITIPPLVDRRFTTTPVRAPDDMGDHSTGDVAAVAAVAGSVDSGEGNDPAPPAAIGGPPSFVGQGAGTDSPGGLQPMPPRHPKHAKSPNAEHGQAARQVGSPKAAKAAKEDQSGKPAKADKAAGSAKAGKAAKSAKTDTSAKSAKTDTSARAAISGI